jgi:hypothetical protein
LFDAATDSDALGADDNRRRVHGSMYRLCRRVGARRERVRAQHTLARLAELQRAPPHTRAPQGPAHQPAAPGDGVC